MADENATGAQDTGLSNVTDTMSEADAEADILAIGEEYEAEASKEETTDEAATESEESTEEEADGSVEDEAIHQDNKQEETRVSQEEVKHRNDEYAKRRIAEREERMRELEESQDAFVSEASDDTDLAIRQLKVDAYNNKVQINSDKLQTGLDRAVASIDLFRTGSEEEKEALVSAVDDFERMFVNKDTAGNPLEVRADIHQFLQQKAESIRKLTAVGARQQVQAKKQEKARTDTVPTRSPAKPKVDSVMDGFDKEAGF